MTHCLTRPNSPPSSSADPKTRANFNYTDRPKTFALQAMVHGQCFFPETSVQFRER